MKSGSKPTNGHTSEPFEDLLQTFKKKAEGLKGKTLEDLSGDLKNYIHEHPFRSLILAAGAGFVLGLLFKRKN